MVNKGKPKNYFEANNSQDKRNKYLLIAFVAINFLLLLGLLYFWLWWHPQQRKGLLNNISDLLKGLFKVVSKDLKKIYSLDKRKSEFENKKDISEYSHEFLKIMKSINKQFLRQLLKDKKRLVAFSKSLERMAKKLERVEMDSEKLKNGNIQISRMLSSFSNLLSTVDSDLFDETIKSLLKDIENSSDDEFIRLASFVFKMIIQMEDTIDPDAKNEEDDSGSELPTEEKITFDYVQNVIYMTEETLAVSQILEEEL